MDPLLDDPDEPRTPDRSPSRLDFCMEEDDSGMDWVSTSHAFIDEDAFAVDIAPLDLTHPTADPPHTTDLHENESHMPHAPSDSPTSQVVIQPQAPIPVRPPSVQLQVDAQEPTPPPHSTMQRPNYPHHGLSRSALLQQKIFWNSRHEEWVEWQSRIEQESMRNDAYTGLATARVVESPYMRPPPSGLERDLVDIPPKGYEQDIQSSIYPRVGDISALRDPYSVNIDRCFFRYPLWTLHKMLYVFDMQQGPSPVVQPAIMHNMAQVQESVSSSTLSSYSTSEDVDEESDSTLVTDDSPVCKAHPRAASSKRASPISRPLTPSWSRFGQWGLSWYARWELLIGLFQRDHPKCEALEMLIRPPPECKATHSPSPPASLLHVVAREVEDDDEEEEEEDYGTVISHSNFRMDFEEECERAMAFYNRESRRLKDIVS